MMKKQVLPGNLKRVNPNNNSKSKSPFNAFKRTPPKNIFAKAQSKQFPLMGVTFSAKQPNKTKNIYQNRAKSRKVYRNLTLEMIQMCGSEVDNVEERSLTPRITKFGEDQHFSYSLNKIAQISSRCNANTISNELNDVLNMIKEEKLKINQKMKILKKTNEYYRKICEGQKTKAEEIGTNTIDILYDQNEANHEDRETQMQIEDIKKLGEKINQQIIKNREQIRQRQSQTYVKLYAMLEDMGINYKSILPQPPIPIVQSEDERYKVLTLVQTIKVQKFFIQKLASKLFK